MLLIKVEASISRQHVQGPFSVGTCEERNGDLASASLSLWKTKSLLYSRVQSSWTFFSIESDKNASIPELLPVHDLVEADLWDQLPADLDDLLKLLPGADLYLELALC